MSWAHELSPLWLGDLKSKNYATSDLIPCPHNFHLSVSGRREEEEEGGDAKQGESGSPGPFLLPAARTSTIARARVRAAEVMTKKEKAAKKINI